MFLGIRRLLAFCVVFLAMPVLPTHADDRLVVVADEWPPFSGEGLPGQGISLDVTRAVLERAGFTVETAVLPWSRVVSGAKAGDYDVVTSLFLDVDLAKSLLYSDPFFTTEVQFVRAKGADATYRDLQSLRPYTIAVGIDFLYEERFDRADFLNKFEVMTAYQGIQMVASGRVDLTLDSTHVIRHSIQQGDRSLLDKIEFIEPALTSQNIHMAISRLRPDHKQVAQAFNTTLAQMRADGTLDALLAKHLVE